MHHNADPETKDQAEATRLPYWVARLFMQSTGDSILARHECQNHWLHPEMRRLYVSSEKPDQGTTHLSWAHIKALGESCHWHIHTRRQELSLHSNYYSGYFEVDQLHGKTGTVITKNLKKQPTFKELSPLVKGKTVRIMPLPHDKGQRWFKAEIEELADVRSYKVKTEDGRILCRNRRHLCRSREPFYSSQPTTVTLQALDMAASPEKLQGPQPTEGQSFPTVPAQGGKSKRPTKTPVAISSKAHPLCTTLNKSQPVENRITSAGRLSKPPGYLKDYAWLHLMIVRDS